MISLPIYQKVSSDISFTVNLEKVTCRIRLMWNTKSKYWMVNTYSEPETGKVLTGIKIFPNYPFLERYNTSLKGQLIAMKVGKDTENYITYDNFGTGWGLFYITASEFEEWRELSGF